MDIMKTGITDAKEKRKRRYGSDPRFKFLVSRAVYKGILRHVAAQYGRPFVVQPLPVDGLSLIHI